MKCGEQCETALKINDYMHSDKCEILYVSVVEVCLQLPHAQFSRYYIARPRHPHISIERLSRILSLGEKNLRIKIGGSKLQFCRGSPPPKIFGILSLLRVVLRHSDTILRS